MKANLTIILLLITSFVTAQEFKTLEDKERLNNYKGFFNFWHDEVDDKI